MRSPERSAACSAVSTAISTTPIRDHWNGSLGVATRPPQESPNRSPRPMTCVEINPFTLEFIGKFVHWSGFIAPRAALLGVAPSGRCELERLAGRSHGNLPRESLVVGFLGSAYGRQPGPGGEFSHSIVRDQPDAGLVGERPVDGRLVRGGALAHLRPRAFRRASHLQADKRTEQDLAMIFKPATWYRIAVALSAINVVSIGFAVGEGQPLHAAVHAGLALAFAWWAQHLRQRPAGNEFDARLEVLEVDVSDLRQQLSETQERLDFAERLLAQVPEPRRVDPQH